MPVLAKCFKSLVKTVLCCICLLACSSINAQERQVLSLQQAFSIAEKNYPLILQKGLLQQSEQLSLENLNTGYLPQLSVNGQATYQSDVTRVDIPIPNLKIPAQSKDQYRAVAEVDQLLYDGGAIRKQKAIQQLSTGVEENRLAVSLYELRTRINQLYFGILYQDELLRQADLLIKDVQIGIDKVKPQVENGVMLRSNLLQLQAQLLQTSQRKTEIRATRKGFAEALSLYIGQPVSETTLLERPTIKDEDDTTIDRPELKLYEAQSLLLTGQQKMISARNMPKASAFIQGGYGRPGLNLLSNEFKPFYISGVRINWSLGGLYTTRRERKLTDISRQTVDLQKNVFMLNTKAQLKQVHADMEKYDSLMNTDKEIVQLRQQITEAAKAQLENKVITASDYLIQLNAEDEVRQMLILHQLQWLQSRINYAIVSGKL